MDCTPLLQLPSYFKDGSTLLQALKGWEARFTQQVHEVRDNEVMTRVPHVYGMSSPIVVAC